MILMLVSSRACPISLSMLMLIALVGEMTLDLFCDFPGNLFSLKSLPLHKKIKEITNHPF